MTDFTPTVLSNWILRPGTRRVIGMIYNSGTYGQVSVRGAGISPPFCLCFLSVLVFGGTIEAFCFLPLVLVAKYSAQGVGKGLRQAVVRSRNSDCRTDPVHGCKFAPAFLQRMEGFCAGSTCVQQAFPCCSAGGGGGVSSAK